MQVDIERFQAQLRKDLDALTVKVDHLKLKEEEIDLIVDKVCTKLEERVYRDVGVSIMGLAQKGFILFLLFLAGYGLKSHF